MTRRPQHVEPSQNGPSLTNGPSLITRNLRLGRGRTSIRLEHMEWLALDAICAAEGIDRHNFATQVDRDPQRREKTLTSRVRSAILAYYVTRSGLTLALNGKNGRAPLGFSPAPAAAEREESRN